MISQSRVREFKDRLSSDYLSIMPSGLCREIVAELEELQGRVQAYVEARDEADRVNDDSDCDCDIWQAAYHALCSAEDALRATLPAQPAKPAEGSVK